jgi:hypothetical protein
MTEKEEGRLATRIDPAVDERLRLTATVKGQRIGRFLNELLDAHLPSMGELADLVGKKGSTRDDSAR